MLLLSLCLGLERLDKGLAVDVGNPLALGLVAEEGLFLSNLKEPLLTTTLAAAEVIIIQHAVEVAAPAAVDWASTHRRLRT